MATAAHLEVLKKRTPEDDQINWVTAFFMAVFHIGAVAALFFFSWKLLLLLIVINWISGSLGIGMGYHRLLTHRGYKTPKWVEYFLTLCGTLASKAAQFSGWPRTAFIISSPTFRVIRTPPSTANG